MRAERNVNEEHKRTQMKNLSMLRTIVTLWKEDVSKLEAEQPLDLILRQIAKIPRKQIEKIFLTSQTWSVMTEISFFSFLRPDSLFDYFIQFWMIRLNVIRRSKFNKTMKHNCKFRRLEVEAEGRTLIPKATMDRVE